MPSPRVFAVLLLATLAFVGCERDSSTPPTGPSEAIEAVGQFTVSPEAIADQVTRVAGWEIDPAAFDEFPQDLPRTANAVRNFERNDLGGGIAHYAFEVTTGPGTYDRIRLHRVVKERRPGRPGRKLANLFLQHGDAKDFTGMFLPGTRGPNTPDDFGIAIYLAENGVDVWGIDQGWCLIPADETDQSIGIDWGLQRAADELRLGMAIARFSRLLTASGAAPLNVLGYSSGVFEIFAAANDEAVLPRWQRNIGGLVPADFYFKAEMQQTRDLFCAYAEFDRAQLDAGNYLVPIPFRAIADLYVDDPEGPSPIFEGFTNSQVFWFYTAGLIFDPETFHYFASADDDGDFFADRFLHVDEAWVIDFLRAGIPYQTQQFIYDYDRTICDVDDVPWDDNLSQIEVPIYYWAANGGATDLGLYTLGLTSSEDVSSLIVSTQPDITVDFGHIDLFLAPIAEQLAWEPLLEWVLEHQPRRGRGQGPRDVDAR
jgi:hypothetical protein